MGPTNVALVKLFRAEQLLRGAHGRLEAATRDVRIQQAKVKDLTERLQLAQSKVREQQSQAAQLELDLRSRDTHIEKLRTQQQEAKSNKEYQAFLVEISTEKVDRNKVEDTTIQAMETVERGQGEVKDLMALLSSDQARLETMQQQIGERLAILQTEIDGLKAKRDEAAAGVPRKELSMFERLADRFDGEAMSAMGKPDRRREEYICSACNMWLVADIYNRLRVRNEPVFCPSCHRMLFIPEDLSPELAINMKKVTKAKVEEE